MNVGKRGDNEGQVCESSDGSRGCSVRGQLKLVIGAGIHSGNACVSYPSFCDLVRLDTSLVCERGWCKSLMGMRPWKYWGPNQGHEVPLLAATWYADREVRPRLWRSADKFNGDSIDTRYEIVANQLKAETRKPEQLSGWALLWG